LSVRRRLCFALAVTAWAVAATSVSAQALWRGLAAGARANDVIRAFPEASRPPVVVTLADGETDDLVTHGLFWNDRLMEVRFFFRAGGLASVQLTPAALDPAAPATNLALAHDECGDRSFADIALFECKWTRQPVVVRLWYESAAGQSPTLRIAYRMLGDISYDF
jgi:hypothetical protein